MPTKQRDGRYRTRVVVGHKANGDPIIKYASGKTKKELAVNVAQIKEEAMGPTPSARRDITLKEFGDAWYKAYKEPHIRLTTRQMYVGALEAHIYPALGAEQLRALTSLKLQIFVNTLSGWSVSLIRKVMLTLDQMFERALLDGLINRNPMKGVVVPNGTQEEKRALTADERTTVQNVGATHPDGLLFMLFYFAGLRRGEAVGLQWGDIDFDANMIRIHRQVTYISGRGYLQLPKTKAGLRSVPLLAPLRTALLPLRGLPAAYVLSMPDGSFIGPSVFRVRWQRLITAAGTPSITPHMLRHNFATLLYEAEVDILSAQMILGHANYKVTADIYTHLTEKSLAGATEKMEIEVDPSKKAQKNNVAKMLPKPGGQN